jgi:hypothetical protein
MFFSLEKEMFDTPATHILPAAATHQPIEIKACSSEEKSMYY